MPFGAMQRHLETFSKANIKRVLEGNILDVFFFLARAYMDDVSHI